MGLFSIVWNFWFVYVQCPGSRKLKRLYFYGEIPSIIHYKFDMQDLYCFPYFLTFNQLTYLNVYIFVRLMAQHSIYNQGQVKLACGLPLVPFKTQVDGPAKMNYQFKNMDIIDEAITYFRINVLFKNFEIRGPGDKVLVYLFVLISHLFKTVEQIKDEPTAKKRLLQVIALPIPAPKQKGNFMAVMLQDGNPSQRELYNQYIKQLRAQTANRLLKKFYGEGFVNDDLKFWAGLSKKKFMGLNFTSMF